MSKINFSRVPEGLRNQIMRLRAACADSSATIDQRQLLLALEEIAFEASGDTSPEEEVQEVQEEVKEVQEVQETPEEEEAQETPEVVKEETPWPHWSEFYDRYDDFETAQHRLVDSGFRPNATEVANVDFFRHQKTLFTQAARELGYVDYIKAMYIYSQCVNQNTLRKMNTCAAVSFIPSPKVSRFEAHPLLVKTANAMGKKPIQYLEEDYDPLFYYTGIAVARLQDMLIAVLTRQCWKRPEPTWRFDAFTPWVDNQGRLRCGGIEGDGTGNSTNHFKFFFDVCEAPRLEPQVYFQQWPATTYEATRGILAVEEEILANNPRKTTLSMPRLWWGFMRQDDFPTEPRPTKSFKDFIRGIVSGWAFRNHPSGFHAVTDAIAEMKLPTPIKPNLRWEALEEILGENLEYILNLAWSEAVTHFDGLYWLPGDFFSRTYPGKKPWHQGNCVDHILSLDASILGRQALIGKTRKAVIDPMRSAFQVIGTETHRPGRNLESQVLTHLVGVDQRGSVYELLHPALLAKM